MPLTLTSDQVLGMAPDAASAKAGKELATVRKWGVLGTDDKCAWGECQGSGSVPYKTGVDFSELVTKCSCPSRKFPCKHGIALLLLLAEQTGEFTAKQRPIWMSEWLDSRNLRAEKKAKKADEVEKPVDPVAQAKRAEQRKVKVAAGVAELDRWLQDLMRQGLAKVQNKPYSFWEGTAARLVDAQAPGLARMVRECAGVSSQGEGWQSRLLERLGKLYLLVEAYARLDTLPEDLQDEIRFLIGYNVEQKDVLAGDAVFDEWHVIGQRLEVDDKLKTQRSWLYGRTSARWALVLSFAHGNAPMDNSLVAGMKFNGELAFYPGSLPLRALVKSREEQLQPSQEMFGHSLEAALDAYSIALSKNPWVERYPMCLSEVQATVHENNWSVVDTKNAMFKMRVAPMVGWQMLALSVGRPVSVFGEWNGKALAPLAVAVDGKYTRL